MSYDLYFWKQQGNCEVTPEKTMNMLIEDQQCDHLEPVDIEKAMQSIKNSFPKYEENITPSCYQLIIEQEDTGLVIVGKGANHFWVESHSAPGDFLNQFIDIAWDIDCKLYDPQTNERYNG